MHVVELSNFVHALIKGRTRYVEMLFCHQGALLLDSEPWQQLLQTSAAIPGVHSNKRNERNVLFNDTLNTFYLRFYGLRHMVKDHSDSERGNLLLPHGLLFLISSKCSLLCIIQQTKNTHTMAFTPVVEHWLEREIAQCRIDPMTHQSYILLQFRTKIILLKMCILYFSCLIK